MRGVSNTDSTYYTYSMYFLINIVIFYIYSILFTKSLISIQSKSVKYADENLLTFKRMTFEFRSVPNCIQHVIITRFIRGQRAQTA